MSILVEDAPFLSCQHAALPVYVARRRMLKMEPPTGRSRGSFAAD